VTDLFHRALEHPPEQRARWLASACDDPALRDEVASLLAAHQGAGPFLASAPPPTIGPYRIQRALGAGGMGVVYLAEDTRLGRTVALKALAPETTDDPVRRERLRREARAAASLSHPGIATIFALEEIDGALYMASEFVAGETLRAELERGPLAPAVVADTGVALSAALAAAHAGGVIHRDIKPENIMRTADGGIKILDFGLAQDVTALAQPGGETRLTRDGGVLGTPAYMSPEQIRRQPVDGRSDLFALGTVLYELATGVHPFADATAAATIANVLERDPAPIPGPLDPIVRRCLRKTAAARYGSATEVGHALEALRTGRVDRSAPAEQPTTRPLLWWWQFHQAMTTIAYVALLLPIWWATTWIGGATGLSIFLVALAAVLSAASLRLHLWFTVRWYPAERQTQERRGRPWIRAADLALAAAMLATVGLTMRAHSRIAALLVASTVVVVVSSTIIEPATSRAAWTEP
jgi:hypothetical protein